MKAAEKELAKRFVYTQRAARLAQGNSAVESLISQTPSQSATEQGCVQMTVRQKMWQFDAARRELWQGQMEVLSCSIKCLPLAVWHYVGRGVYPLKTLEQHPLAPSFHLPFHFLLFGVFLTCINENRLN